MSVVGVACGGSEADPLLESYFQQIEPIINTIDDRSGTQVIGSPSQTLAFWAGVLRQSADGLDSIEVPVAAADAHRELTEGLREGAGALDALAADHPEVPSVEEAEALRNEDEAVVAAAGRARQACAELELIAEDHGVGIDLELC